MGQCQEALGECIVTCFDANLDNDDEQLCQSNCNDNYDVCYSHCPCGEDCPNGCENCESDYCPTAPTQCSDDFVNPDFVECKASKQTQFLACLAQCTPNDFVCFSECSRLYDISMSGRARFLIYRLSFSFFHFKNRLQRLSLYAKLP